MCGTLFQRIVLTFPLLLHLNGLYSRLIYRWFYYVIRLRLRSLPGYYQRHLWPYNPVHTCIWNCLCMCMFSCVRMNDDDVSVVSGSQALTSDPCDGSEFGDQFDLSVSRAN